MSKRLSLPEMLADLERRVAFHRQQEEMNAEREAFHHEERARHAAALAEAAQQLAVLQAATAGAEALLREAAPLPAPAEKPEAAPPRVLSKLIALTVGDWPDGEPFGASDVAAEIERRFERQVFVPTVSRTLLRFAKTGVIRTHRPGVSYAETLYETKRRL
jgi:hypothetical protein